VVQEISDLNTIIPPATLLGGGREKGEGVNVIFALFLFYISLWF